MRKEMRSLIFLALVWVIALVLIGTVARRQAMAQSRCLLCGTANSKMRANPLTGQIYGVQTVITPSPTPTPTAAPTNTAAPTATPT
jgi:hypothetical protein